MDRIVILLQGLNLVMGRDVLFEMKENLHVELIFEVNFKWSVSRGQKRGSKKGISLTGHYCK